MSRNEIYYEFTLTLSVICVIINVKKGEGYEGSSYREAFAKSE